MTLKHYTGGCHCGAVRYEAELDLAKGTNRCNCTICTKSRAWFAFVPGDKFRFTAGEDIASEYRWKPPKMAEPFLTYRFCSRCGIRLFGTGDAPQLGGRFFALHIPTLDDVDVEELAAAPINYADGAHDRFNERAPDTRLM